MAGHKFSPLEIELYSRQGISIYICIFQTRLLFAPELWTVCGNRSPDLRSAICVPRSAWADQTGSINAKKHPTKVAKKPNNN